MTLEEKWILIVLNNKEINLKKKRKSWKINQKILNSNINNSWKIVRIKYNNKNYK